MRGWRDAAFARDRVTHAIKQFKDGKSKQHEARKKVAV